MKNSKVVGAAEWLRARQVLLAKEKEFTRARDALSEARRDLPWERVEKSYVFEGPAGKETLADLFGGRSQLIVYHFMFGQDSTAGCTGCSFWADNFNGITVHLEQRDVTLLAVSRASREKLVAFQKRLGWSFKWVSSSDSDFNFDYQVSFDPNRAEGASYNYAPKPGPATEMPGISVFYRDEAGAIFHTYSTFGRGLDLLNTAYNYLDLVPKGRDEADLPHRMAWVRHHDNYRTAL
jgi:predicted dithiol-disulfide oxidoreductase (DUF899 family)